MKTPLFTIALLGLLLTTLTITAQNSGTAGSLTWSYAAATKTLSITGTGAMPDYEYSTVPWKAHRNEIEKVTIGNGVASVGSNAFSRCGKVKSIVLPATLSKIEFHAFSFCEALQSIALPASLTEIGNYAFLRCLVLTGFKVDPDNAHFAATDGVLYNKAKNHLIYYPLGKTSTSFSVPTGVSAIGEYAFDGAAKLQRITLPSGMKTIGNQAFEFCEALQSIVLPEGITQMGRYAFFSCKALKSITLPSTVTTIGHSAFDGCTALSAIDVGAGNAHFISVDGVLYNKGKTELLRYPIGKPGAAFTVPAGVKKIEYSAFSDCRTLQSILLPDGLTVIDEYAFYYCSGLQGITFPSTVTTIGNSAFYYCGALQSIVIPSTVITIGNFAFGDCRALKQATVGWATPLAVSANIFKNVTLSGLTLHVPVGKKGAYQAAEVWKDFGKIEEEATSLPLLPEALGLCIHSAVGKLRFTAAQAVEVRIFTPSGSCVASQLLPAGESSVSLPQGIYLIQAGKSISKQVVR